MLANCPNCRKQFVDERAGAFCCDVCGWFIQTDGEWIPWSEPEPLEPEPPEPEPPEPEPPEPLLRDVDPGPKVTSYLGGLLTVTEVDDNDEEKMDEKS